jgi:hypothetical protein
MVPYPCRGKENSRAHLSTSHSKLDGNLEYQLGARIFEPLLSFTWKEDERLLETNLKFPPSDLILLEIPARSVRFLEGLLADPSISERLGRLIRVRVRILGM